MGLFNFKEKADAKVQKLVDSILLPGEEVQTFKPAAQGDFYALTNKRLLICDRDFSWGDSKQSIFSIAPSKITAVSMTNPIAIAPNRFKVGIHVGGLTTMITFFKEDEAREAYNFLNGLVF